MIYEATTTKGVKLELKNPVFVRINKDEKAPADSIYAEFPLDTSTHGAQKLSSIKEVRVYADKDSRLVFDGIVDEQLVKVSDKGCILELSGRSVATFLLDNEAMPQTYCMPSLRTIFERHVKPYGFLGYKGSDSSFSGEFVVKKGMSEWEVLCTFCEQFLGVVPRITAGKIIDVTQQETTYPITFSNHDEGIKYTAISEENNPYKLISQVNVRTSKDGSYKTKFTNDLALRLGVTREIYIDSMEDITPAITAKRIIDEGNANYYQIALSCPNSMSAINTISKAAIIDDAHIGYITGMKLKSISYILGNNTEKCDIVLNKGVM